MDNRYIVHLVVPLTLLLTTAEIFEVDQKDSSLLRERVKHDHRSRVWLWEA